MFISHSLATAIPSGSTVLVFWLPCQICCSKFIFTQFCHLNKRELATELWSLYGTDSVRTGAREIVKYKFDLVEVQEVRRERGGTQPTGDYKFFYGNGNENHEFRTRYFSI
jgi:hypothetical protein